MRTIDWVDDAIEMVDQTVLPGRLDVLRLTDVAALVDAIRRLAVRGAPALGVAGALGVALAARSHDPASAAFAADVDALRSARPTAVNLARGVDRARRRAADGPGAVLAEALAIRDEEIAASWAMGRRGADLADELLAGAPVAAMTICNTGGLAAVERGTALAVVTELHERGRLTATVVLETRPLLQGARLTTWELARAGVGHRLAVDSAAASLLARGAANLVVTGADRIAANGDTANKIGTLGLALAARHAGVPFVVVAPESTVDLDTPTGAAIDIEDRGDEEVCSLQGVRTAPPGTATLNPAFDVTPAALVTAVVTERRVVRVDRGEDLLGGQSPQRLSSASQR